MISLKHDTVQSFLLALLEVGVLGCTIAFNVIKNWIITRVIFFFANDPCVVTSHLQFDFKKNIVKILGSSRHAIECLPDIYSCDIKDLVTILRIVLDSS